MKHFSERNFYPSKDSHASLVLLFELRNKEEVICKNEKRIL